MAGEAVVGALRVVIGADTADLDKGLKSSNDNVKNFGAGVEKASNTVTSALNKMAASFGIDVSPLKKGLEETALSMGSLSTTSQKLGLVAGAALAGLTVAAVAASAALIHGFGAAIDRADEMSKAAQKFGVPIEQLSSLKYAADLADVSFEALGKGLGKLSKNMSEAAGGGSSDATRAFEALNISVKNTDGTLKSNSQVLGEVADKFKGMEDSAGKTALAMAIFGKSGAELIPLLNGGSASIKELSDEASKLGLVFDQNTGSAAERTNDAFKKLGLVFEGFSNQLLPTLIPAVANLAEKMAETAIQSGVAKSAAEGVVYALVEMTKTAIAVYSALDAVAQGLNVLNTVGQIVGNTLHGQITGNFDLMKASIDNASAAAANAVAKFGELMDPSVNPIADAGKTGAVKENVDSKITAPIIQAKTAAEKAKTATDEWGRSLDETAVKKRAMDLIVGAQEPWQQYNTAIAKADADLKLFGATNEQIGAVHQKIAEKYQNTWAQVAPAVAGSFKEIATSFEGSSKSMATVAKVAGIVQATISMFVGAAKALELPFPANLAAGAAVLAQGAALVAQVKSVGGFATGGSFRVGGAGGFDNQKVMMDLSPGEQVDVWRPGDPRGGTDLKEISINMQGEMFGQKTIRKLVEQLNEAYGNGARLRFAS